MKSKIFTFMLITLLLAAGGLTYLCVRLQTLFLANVPDLDRLNLTDTFHTFLLLNPTGVIVTAVVGVALLSFFIFVTLTLFLRPLKKMNESLIAVANGDYEVKLPVRGKDELAEFALEFNRVVKHFRKKLAVQKYVSKSTALMINNLKTGEFTVEPERKEMTILFSDVRGFTAFTEAHDPFEVVNRINKLFDIQVEVIIKNEGDIDKFVGDEIMATFPNPSFAFKAACEIQKKISSYNKNLKEPLPVGIGISFGEAVIGAIGSGDSFDWTSIGDTVNEAARLCSAAEGGRILLSEEAFLKIKTQKSYEESELKLKGKKHPKKVYSFEA